MKTALIACLLLTGCAAQQQQLPFRPYSPGPHVYSAPQAYHAPQPKHDRKMLLVGVGLGVLAAGAAMNSNQTRSCWVDANGYRWCR